MTKDLHWIGSSKKEIKTFPECVREEMGFALLLAQQGDRAIDAVSLVGFGSSKVVEVVVSEHGCAYRAVYTVKFSEAVYVLDAFQKKSKKGVSTPKHIMSRIRRRLKVAENHYKKNYKEMPKRRRP